MGSFFVNHQVRSTDANAVAQVVRELASGRASVSDVENGWVTIYDQSCESLDANEITRLARELSSRLGAAVFAFVVYDSDVFLYYLFEAGLLVDEYNSNPAYFGEVPTEENRHRLAGQPPTVLRFCPPGTELLEVESAMGWTQSSSEGGFASSVLADDRVRRLAAALGIDEVRATLGFTPQQQQRRSLKDIARFNLVQGGKTQRPGRGPIPPRVPPR